MCLRRHTYASRQLSDFLGPFPSFKHGAVPGCSSDLSPSPFSSKDHGPWFSCPCQALRPCTVHAGSSRRGSFIQFSVKVSSFGFLTLRVCGSTPRPIEDFPSPSQPIPSSFLHRASVFSPHRVCCVTPLPDYSIQSLHFCCLLLTESSSEALLCLDLSAKGVALIRDLILLFAQ